MGVMHQCCAAGDDDSVLFQTDIQAITAALDEYPQDRPATAPSGCCAGMHPGRAPFAASPGARTSPSQIPSAAQGARVAPLRKSRVTAARGSPNPLDCVSICGGGEMCRDVGELQLRLAVAVRQAEHFRRESEQAAESVRHDMASLAGKNRELQERVERMQVRHMPLPRSAGCDCARGRCRDMCALAQGIIDAEAFLDNGDRDNTTSLLGDDFANNLRAEEAFDKERKQLQARSPSSLLTFAARVSHDALQRAVLPWPHTVRFCDGESLLLAWMCAVPFAPLTSHHSAGRVSRDLCLQAEVRHWQEKHAVLANQKLPCAEAAAGFAEEDAAKARKELQAAREELAAMRQEMRQARAAHEQARPSPQAATAA